MRSLWVLFCALAIPCISLGQANQSSWKNLNSLRAGEQITVVAAHSQKYTGTFATVSDDAIKLDGPTGEETVQRTDVKRVTVPNKHRLRDTLIVTGVGAGVGAGIGAGVANSIDFFSRDKARGAGIGAVLGAVVGALVGAVSPHHSTVYRAPH